MATGSNADIFETETLFSTFYCIFAMYVKFVIF